MNELVQAYAISIHKYYDVEYSSVFIHLSTQHYVMLQRNLLYTGVTRGKRLVLLVDTKKALAIAIKNNKIMKRNSGLADRLRKPD